MECVFKEIICDFKSNCNFIVFGITILKNANFIIVEKSAISKLIKWCIFEKVIYLGQNLSIWQ
jgi:hypothetical protein